jgi:DNA helicase-2/ATP-dependent DNA helicase PcrA
MKSDLEILEGLTESQRKAVTHLYGPLLIIAGPGSGKTEVISRRAAFLVQSGSAKPENLLVTTFTEKASLELKDRIQSKLPDVNVESMQISTIHSFCHTLLNDFIDQSPFRSGFRVLDDAGQLLFIYTRRVELGLNGILKGRESDFFSEVKRLYNLASEEQIEPQDLVAFCQEKTARAGPDEKTLWKEKEIVARSYQRYLQSLHEANSTDFSNLQRHAYNLIKNNKEILQALRQRFSFILIDEYQDTNGIQDRILKTLAEPKMNVTVVGDDDQSIYRFRGATVKNILNFETTYGAKQKAVEVVKLEDNFRSLESILHHTSRLIRRNPLRKDKNLLCHRNRFANDILLVHRETAAEEAEAVVRILGSYIKAGIIKQKRDVAILLRSVRSYAAPYLESLKKYDIPYVLARDGGFFTRPDILDIYNLFVFLGQTKSWADKFVCCDTMNLSQETAAALRSYKQDISKIKKEAELRTIGVKNKDDARRIIELVELKRRALGKKFLSIMELLYELFRITGYFERSERRGDQEAIRNLAILTGIAEVFDEHGKTSNVYPFLFYLKLLKQSGLDSFMLAPSDAIQVMTVHQAKGLEFPVVVIGAAMERRFPASNRKPWYEIPYCLCDSGEPEVADYHTADERKLFYVASTRARDLLIIGSADVVNKRGGGPSRFISELLGNNMDRAIQRTEKVLSSLVEVEESTKKSYEPKRRLSYSQLAYFLQCPLRFKYMVVDGLSVLHPYYLNFGANVHRALELIHRAILDGRTESEIDIKETVEKAWSPLPNTSKERETELEKAAVKQIESYVSKFHPARMHIEDVEARFSYEANESIVTGRIDLVRRLDGGAREIIDFKTIESRYGSRDQTNLQMDLYALGGELCLGHEVGSRTIHYLGDNEQDTSGWDENRRKTAEKTLYGIIEKINNEEFAPRTEYCPFCQDFGAICPYSKNR